MTQETGIYQYCIQEGCPFTATWNGGSAGEDPSLPHLFMHPEHTVRSGVNEEHKRNYELQKSGEVDVTRDKIQTASGETPTPSNTETDQ